MARPRSEAVRVRYAPAQSVKTPWGVFWRVTNPRTGDRDKCSEFYATEADAVARKAAIDAALADVQPLPAPLPARRPASAARASDLLAATARPGSLTFRQHADDWLAKIVARRKASTAKSYADTLRLHVYDVIGDIRLSPATFGAAQLVAVVSGGINRHVLRNGQPTAAHGTPMSWGTQKAVLRVLSSCLRWAVRFGHLTANPASGLIRELRDDSRGQYDDPEPNPLTRDQMDAFLAWLITGTPTGPIAVVKTRGGSRKAAYPEWHPYFLALFRTGMRRGEAAALRWSTVFLDVDQPYARLERNYSDAEARRHPGQTGDTTLKNKKMREIDLSPGLVAVLRGLAADRGAAFRDDYVFRTVQGARILPTCRTAERVFELGMAAIGAASAHHTLHDCRDTFATVHLNARTPVLWIAKMLGHADASTTLRRYAKWKPSGDDGATYAAAMDGDAAAGRSRQDGAR